MTRWEGTGRTEMGQHLEVNNENCRTGVGFSSDTQPAPRLHQHPKDPERDVYPLPPYPQSEAGTLVAACKDRLSRSGVPRPHVPHLSTLFATLQKRCGPCCSQDRGLPLRTSPLAFSLFSHPSLPHLLLSRALPASHRDTLAPILALASKTILLGLPWWRSG